MRSQIRMLLVRRFCFWQRQLKLQYTGRIVINKLLKLFSFILMQTHLESAQCNTCMRCHAYTTFVLVYDCRETMMHPWLNKTFAIVYLLPVYKSLYMTLRYDGSYLHRIGYIHEDICSQVTTVIKRVLKIKYMLNETRRKQTEIRRT